jgi:preprotein translocase subunit YajC
MTLLAAASSSSSSAKTSNPLVSLLPLVFIFGLVYVLFLRPRAQQARRQRDTLMELSAGDEVLTGAGIFGTVLDVESDRVTIETAPGTRITVLRSTIARKMADPAEVTPSWDEHDEDEAHGAYHEYEHDEHEEHEDHDAEAVDEHGALASDEQGASATDVHGASATDEHGASATDEHGAPATDEHGAEAVGDQGASATDEHDEPDGTEGRKT